MSDSNTKIIVIAVVVALAAVAGTYFVMSSISQDDGPSTVNVNTQWSYHNQLNDEQKKYYDGKLYINVNNMLVDYYEERIVNNQSKTIKQSEDYDHITYVPRGYEDVSKTIAQKYTYLWNAKNEGCDKLFYLDPDFKESITAYKFTLQDGNQVYVGPDGVIYEIIYHSKDEKSVIIFYNDLVY